MNERALRVLEFTKIREMLAAFALSDAGKEACLSLVPLQEIADVNRARGADAGGADVFLLVGISVNELLCDLF